MSADPSARIPAARRANKAEVAAWFDVSITTVGNWITRGCPVVQRGEMGVPWVFDLLAVAEWRLGRRDNAALATDPDQMAPKERKDWYDSEIKRTALEREARQLIPAAEVEQVIATALSALAQGMRAIPDLVERRTGAAPELAQAVGGIIDDELDVLAARIADLSPTDVREVADA